MILYSTSQSAHCVHKIHDISCSKTSSSARARAVYRRAAPRAAAKWVKARSARVWSVGENTYTAMACVNGWFFQSGARPKRRRPVRLMMIMRVIRWGASRALIITEHVSDGFDWSSIVAYILITYNIVCMMLFQSNWNSRQQKDTLNMFLEIIQITKRHLYSLSLASVLRVAAPHASRMRHVWECDVVGLHSVFNTDTLATQNTHRAV